MNGALEAPPCPFCGSEEFEVVYAGCPDRRHWLPGRYDVVRCSACGLVRTHPRPAAHAIAAHYPDSYVCFAAERKARSRPYALLRAAIRTPYTVRYGSADPTEPPPPGGGRLLDVGCGAGLFLADMAKLGWEAWGIEPSEETARAARARTRLPSDRIFVGAAEEADYPPESFDLVTMAHVLEHLHQPTEVLRNVHRWLRPGGKLRVWVPNFDSLERKAFGRYWFGLDVPRHLFHFTPASLAQLLGVAGLRVERSVPQWQANTLGWSFSHVRDAVLRRRSEFRESLALYYAFLPLAAALVAFGSGGALDVTARKPADGEPTVAL